MALFRCKMCGGELNLESQREIVFCEYCGTKQTLPKIDDERKSNLYERAGHFRRNNEFDKAAAIYEEILHEDTEDAEAYWSLVLCRFGVEYVLDPATGKRIPTINRVQYTSVFDDSNYREAIRYATPAQQEVYREEATVISEIQKKYLSISQSEAPFDVFLCYKESDEGGRRTPDSVLAQELYYELTEAGFKVFFARITLEDKLGVSYEPYIFAALNSAKIMVVLGTKPEYFNAVWVKNEWSRFLSLIKSGERKVLIPAYRGMDPYNLPEEFSHLQAQDMSKLGFMQDLIRGIQKILGGKKEEAPQERNADGGAATVTALLKRVRIFLEEGSFNQAAQYCERVLDQDPENGAAHVLKLMAQVRVAREADLARYNQPLETIAAYRTALRFADNDTKYRLEQYNAATKKQLNGMLNQQAQIEAEARRREEAARMMQLRQEEERQRIFHQQTILLEQRKIQLAKDKKKHLTLGILFLIFFWPVGIYFLYLHHKDKKDLSALGGVTYKKKGVLSSVFGILSLVIAFGGSVAEIENITNGEPDSFGIVLAIGFWFLGFFLLKKKKAKPEETANNIAMSQAMPQINPQYNPQVNPQPPANTDVVNQLSDFISNQYKR